MSALEGLYRLLSPMGLYRLDGNSWVDQELKTYGAVFEALEEAICALEQDMLTATANPSRMDAWERLLELPRAPQLELDQRRRRVLRCLAVAPDDFTPEGILRSLQGVGIDAEMTENIPQRSLHVRCRSFLGDFGDIYAMLKAAGRMMPAHLAFTLDTGGASWNELEAFFRHWQHFDGLDFSWEAFDRGSILADDE